MSGQLVIRADADSRIGAGHIMRCLALAQGWKRQGGEAVFLGRVASRALSARLTAEGFQLINCVASHPDPRDLEQTSALLADFGPQKGWVVLDGYGFDADYQLRLRESGWRLVVVDDTAQQPAYHADILLNQNVYANDLTYPVQDDTLLLLGRRYVLLRPEFLEASPQEGPVAPVARRLLITMGGADPENATRLVLEALAASGIPYLMIKVVIGPASPHGEDLFRLAATMAGRCEVLTAVTDMPSLMSWADLAVSGAGSTCWELAAMGTPFVTAVLADNQEKVAAALAALEVAPGFGRPATWESQDLANQLRDLLDNALLRGRMRQQGRLLVDGLGADRVVRAMHFYEFILRPVEPADCRMIFDWANDPEIRQASFQSAVISWPEHEQWFAARLADPACVFYLAVSDSGEPFAQIRFDCKDREAVISVGLKKAARGCGLGGRVIRKACRKIFADRGVDRITAWVKKDNAVSRRSFLKAGFVPVSETLRDGIPACRLERRANRGEQ